MLEGNSCVLYGTGRPASMLSSYIMSLSASYVLGADGSISRMGSVTADLHADLFRAVQARDLEVGRRLKRPPGSAGGRVLRTALRVHARPHEGSAGDARAPRQSPRAPAPQARRRRRARAHPPGIVWVPTAVAVGNVNWS